MARVVAHVFVEDLHHPVLGAEDVPHLSRALRLRPGEHVTASDGRGATRLCQWTGQAALSPLAEIATDPLPRPPITVAFALTKGDHPELAVQKLTEAGVDRVMVISTERCVARWAPGTVERHVGKLRQVARQAAMQSRRSWLPDVRGVVAFSALTGPVGAGSGEEAALALAVPGGGPISLETPTVLVGPEGGWSDNELAAVPRHVGLGPHVLRAETAALAAGLLLSALRSGVVAPVAPRLQT